MPKSLHESELKDILTALADIKDGTFFDRQNKSDRLNQSSISRASRDLVMSFPVLCEDTIEPGTASMICKAIERKAITMFQILFSANHMKASGGVELLKKWHNNIASDFNFIDNYMDAMDLLDDKVFESSAVERVRFRRQITEATEDIIAENKRPGKVYLSSISENSLNDYAVVSRCGNIYVTEAKKGKGGNKGAGGNWAEALGKALEDTDYEKPKGGRSAAPPRTSKSKNKDNGGINAGKTGSGLGAPASSGKNTNPDTAQAKNTGTPAPGRTEEKAAKDKKKDRKPAPARNASSNDTGSKATKLSSKMYKPSYDEALGIGGKEGVEYFNKQLLNTDVKKANELVPSLMIVRFVVDDPDNKEHYIQKQFVAGVKARLIPIDSYDLFDRIESKNRDKAGLVQFVRATTKEISFVKDYLLAIDQAKLDAIKTSKNKTNGIFKTLEKRATKSVFNRLVGRGNDAGCITTIVMSQTSVDYLKKESDINMADPRVASKIMDAYNLLCFVIVDESIEVARFLFDGDSLFEQLSFNSLERETGDGSYKKMINLLSKMNR